MFNTYITEGLEKILNQMLQQDPDHQHFLKPLIGRHICLKIKQPSFNLYLSFYNDTIRIRHTDCIKPDCTIAGKSIQFLRYYLAFESEGRFTDIHMDGDINIAQAFAKLCQHVRIDWEALLAKFMGQHLAHILHGAAKQVNTLGKQTAATLKIDLTEFIQHEADLFPHRIEIHEFLDKIDTLRHDVDRLTARLALFKKNLG